MHRIRYALHKRDAVRRAHYTHRDVFHIARMHVGGGTRIIPWIRGRFRRATDSLPYSFHVQSQSWTSSPAGFLGRSYPADPTAKRWSGILQSPTDLQPGLLFERPAIDPKACRLMIQYRALPWLWWSAQKLELTYAHHKHTHTPFDLAGPYYVPSVMLIE